MSDRMILRCALLSGICLATVLLADVQAQQWTVSMRAMQNPLLLGQCTAIEVVVKDASGGTPVRPDGKQVDWQDFDLSLTSTAPDAFAWSNEAHRFLCARAPTAASALVVAYYPARHLAAAEVVPGISAQQTIEVALQGVGQPAATPAPGQPYVPAAVATNPAAPGAQPTPGQPTASPAGAVVVYNPPTNPPTPSGPASAPPQISGAAAPAPLPTATVATLAPAQTEKKGGGGFFGRIGKHLKEKAGEVTSQTAQNLVGSANQVVDATAQSGSNLVSGAAAQTTLPWRFNRAKPRSE
jgi:hypothetical protein